MTDYTEFLRAKIKMASFKGVTLEPSAIHPKLFPFQNDIVRWAVQGGNRAIFAKFGLGKSVMQCEWLRQIIGAAGGLGLIVCPLGVRQELRDALEAVYGANEYASKLRQIEQAPSTPHHSCHVVPE